MGSPLAGLLSLTPPPPSASPWQPQLGAPATRGSLARSNFRAALALKVTCGARAGEAEGRRRGSCGFLCASKTRKHVGVALLVAHLRTKFRRTLGVVACQASKQGEDMGCIASASFQLVTWIGGLVAKKGVPIYPLESLQPGGANPQTTTSFVCFPFEHHKFAQMMMFKPAKEETLTKPLRGPAPSPSVCSTVAGWLLAGMMLVIALYLPNAILQLRRTCNNKHPCGETQKKGAHSRRK